MNDRVRNNIGIERVASGEGGLAGLESARIERRLVRAIRASARGVLTIAALVLLFTGLKKAQAMEAFEGVLRDHRLIPVWARPGVAHSVTGIEIGIAVLALVGLTRPASSRWASAAGFGIALVFLAFMGYSAALSFRPPPEPTSCGCGIRTGVIKDWSPLVVQNGICSAVMAAAALGLSRRTG